MIHEKMDKKKEKTEKGPEKVQLKMSPAITLEIYRKRIHVYTYTGDFTPGFHKLMHPLGTRK